MRRISALILVSAAIASSPAHAEVLELEGTVKSIDPEARSITIERRTASGSKTLTFDVASSAGDLGSVKEGARLTFSYDNKLEVVTALQTGSEGSQLFVTGSEWVGESGGRIRVMHSDGETFVALMYGSGPNMLREIHGKIQGNEVFWMAENVVALKGGPGDDNFGIIRRDKEGVRIDFRFGKGRENATQAFSMRRISKPTVR